MWGYVYEPQPFTCLYKPIVSVVKDTFSGICETRDNVLMLIGDFCCLLLTSVLNDTSV